jgi:hypothetical protein
VSEIYYFSDGDASQNRKGKISSTSAIIQMILVFMLIGTSLQHHMAKIYDTGLWKQKAGRHVCITLSSSKPKTTTTVSLVIFEYCAVQSKEIIVLEERFMTVTFLPLS